MKYYYWQASLQVFFFFNWSHHNFRLQYPSNISSIQASIIMWQFLFRLSGWHIIENKVRQSHLQILGSIDRSSFHVLDCSNRQTSSMDTRYLPYCTDHTVHNQIQSLYIPHHIHNWKNIREWIESSPDHWKFYSSLVLQDFTSLTTTHRNSPILSAKRGRESNPGYGDPPAHTHTTNHSTNGIVLVFLSFQALSL